MTPRASESALALQGEIRLAPFELASTLAKTCLARDMGEQRVYTPSSEHGSRAGMQMADGSAVGLRRRRV